MHVYVCGCLCVCLCVQACTLCFKFRNYRLPTFVNVCVCVQLWSRFLAFQHHFLRMCSHAFQSRRDCFCVRKCERMSVCVRALAIPISLMLVFAFRLYLINITSFNDFQMHKLNYKLQTSTLCLVDDTWS